MRAATVLVVAALASLPNALATAAPPACGAAHWVAAWALSPSDSTVQDPAISAVTLRSTAFPHYGGTQVRVHLSNRLGLGPVLIGSASIGQQSAGAAVVPGSAVPLLFHGRKSVTIGAGAEVVSDAAVSAVTALKQLSISLFVTAATPPSQHVGASQTTYRSPGDRTADASGFGFVALPVVGFTPAVPQNVQLVSEVDVLAPGDVGVVAAFGDSITDGYQADGRVPISAAQLDKNTRYPDQLARRLLQAGRRLSVVDDGISGNQLLVDSPPYEPLYGLSGLHRETPDLLVQAGVSTVILLEGINDINSSAATPAQLEAGYATFLVRAHAKGMRVLLGTITPQNGTGSAEETRLAVDAWIRTQHVSEGVIDFDAAVRDPAHPSQLRPAYDGSDHLHFTAAGYKAMADAVPLGLLSGPSCQAPRPGQAAPTAARPVQSSKTSTAKGQTRSLASTGLAMPWWSVAAALLQACFLRRWTATEGSAA